VIGEGTGDTKHEGWPRVFEIKGRVWQSGQVAPAVTCDIGSVAVAPA